MSIQPLDVMKRKVQLQGKKVSRGIYDSRKQDLVHICGIEGCIMYGGFMELPLCEEHAWKTWAILNNANDEHNRRAEAKAEHDAYVAALAAEEKLKAAKREEKYRNLTSITPGHVYYLQVGELIKIGYTADLYQRLASYPPNSKLLATHPGTLKVERQMHHKFLHRLSSGREWFAPADDLAEHIAKVKRDFKQHILVP